MDIKDLNASEAYAGNAENSLTAKNLKQMFAENPIWGNFWEANISKFMLDRNLKGFTDVSMIDIGCGEGQYTYFCADEALLRGLDTTIFLNDLLPKNLKTSRTNLESLVEKRPQRIHINNLLGNIKSKFPDRKFNLALLVEVIHWETPEGVRQIFELVSDHLEENGLFIVSWATPLNNASLVNSKGDLIMPKTRKRNVPVEKRSFSTNSLMSFWDFESVRKLGIEVGLTPYDFEQVDNVYFPTRIKLHYPFSRQSTSTENEAMAFKKE